MKLRNQSTFESQSVFETGAFRTQYTACVAFGSMICRISRLGSHAIDQNIYNCWTFINQSEFVIVIHGKLISVVWHSFFRMGSTTLHLISKYFLPSKQDNFPSLISQVWSYRGIVLENLFSVFDGLVRFLASVDRLTNAA